MNCSCVGFVHLRAIVISGLRGQTCLDVEPDCDDSVDAELHGFAMCLLEVDEVALQFPNRMSKHPLYVKGNLCGGKTNCTRENCVRFFVHVILYV